MCGSQHSPSWSRHSSPCDTKQRVQAQGHGNMAQPMQEEQVGRPHLPCPLSRDQQEPHSRAPLRILQEGISPPFLRRCWFYPQRLARATTTGSSHAPHTPESPGNPKAEPIQWLEGNAILDAQHYTRGSPKSQGSRRPCPAPPGGST